MISNKLDWNIDSFERAINVLDARDFHRCVDKKLEYLLSIYPEIRHCSHQRIGDILGVERETVSRCINKVLKRKSRKYERRTIS